MRQSLPKQRTPSKIRSTAQSCRFACVHVAKKLPPLPLIRISHGLSTAAADPGMSTSLRSVGLLDVLVEACSFAAGYACGALGRAPCIHARLRRLATKSREKCGLIKRWRGPSAQRQNGSASPAGTKQPRAEEHAKRALEPWVEEHEQMRALKERHRTPAPPLQGLYPMRCIPRIPAASRPAPWAVLRRAFSASCPESQCPSGSLP